MIGGRNRVGFNLAAGAAVALCGPGQAALAQPGQTATAQGQATATVVQALRAVQEEDLAFGAITSSVMASGEVVVDPTGATLLYLGGAQAACPGATASCDAHPARFAVSGEPDRTYAITLPSEVIASGQRTATSLTVRALVASSTNRPERNGGGALDTYGKDSFTVGGTLSVPAGTQADIFRADLPVMVHYD